MGGGAEVGSGGGSRCRTCDGASGSGSGAGSDGPTVANATAATAVRVAPMVPKKVIIGKGGGNKATTLRTAAVGCVAFACAECMAFDGMRCACVQWYSYREKTHAVPSKR